MRSGSLPVYVRHRDAATCARTRMRPHYAHAARTRTPARADASGATATKANKVQRIVFVAAIVSATTPAMRRAIAPAASDADRAASEDVAAQVWEGCAALLQSVKARGDDTANLFVPTERPA